MVIGAGIKDRDLGLHARYQDEVSNLSEIARNGIAKIQSGECNLREQRLTWLIQYNRVQKLYRKLKGI